MQQCLEHSKHKEKFENRALTLQTLSPENLSILVLLPPFSCPSHHYHEMTEMHGVSYRCAFANDVSFSLNYLLFLLYHLLFILRNPTKQQLVP